ncbi:hypothetical protein LTR28_002332, partial [Elasticomyces elasticus]
AQLFDNLQRELADLEELRDNTNNFVTRTIQLVNIRLEDHGKAILVFTIVTIIFLPLNFVTSFFGMNVSDIRNTTRDQRLFWVVAACVTGGVVSGSVFLAFSGNAIWERFVLWKEGRRDRRVKNEGALSEDPASNTKRWSHRELRLEIGRKDATVSKMSIFGFDDGMFGFDDGPGTLKPEH